MGNGSGRRLLAGAGCAVAVGSLLLGQAVAASGSTARQRVPGASYSPAGQALKFGMRGPAVMALQHRLHYLHYFVGKMNGYFGWDTQEAVWAFKEVQTGRIAPAHPNIVSGATQHALMHPRAPRVLFPHGGSWRIEVNKKIEVLVLYKDNKVEFISHVSSASRCRPDGCGWFTPGGFHRAEAYLPGKVADNSFGTSYMYWPIFFIATTYAIHGFPNPVFGNRFYGVPLKPASHGCVRIPLDFSKILHNYVRISPVDGTPIWIYPVNPPNWTSNTPIRHLRPGNSG